MNKDLQTLAMCRSLDGLSVGDAFGECFFSIQLDPLSLDLHLSTRTLPNLRWRWTDDTAMALSITGLLHRDGTIDQDVLANSFAEVYAMEDWRGYGGTAHGILRAIGAGDSWRDVSPKVLSGMGSMGNGGAMRVAPLGVYFADDPAELVVQATRSAEVTHAHPEGQAGAVAVALAAAFVTNRPVSKPDEAWTPFFDFVLRHTPDSLTRAMVAQARDLPPTFDIETAVSVLGNGSKLTAPDTVPLCLWIAAQTMGDFVEAMWRIVPAGGDIDTNCAIVGGIVAANRQAAPPAEWLARREPLMIRPPDCSRTTVFCRPPIPCRLFDRLLDGRRRRPPGEVTRRPSPLEVEPADSAFAV